MARLLLTAASFLHSPSCFLPVSFGSLLTLGDYLGIQCRPLGAKDSWFGGMKRLVFFGFRGLGAHDLGCRPGIDADLSGVRNEDGGFRALGKQSFCESERISQGVRGSKRNLSLSSRDIEACYRPKP